MLSRHISAHTIGTGLLYVEAGNDTSSLYEIIKYGELFLSFMLLLIFHIVPFPRKNNTFVESPFTFYPKFSILGSKEVQKMTHEKILIVEDDVDIMEVLFLSLASAGYEVLKAPTISKGWQAVRKQQPDLILLDVNLPDGNGFELAAKIRKISDAIIIFVTVNSLIEHKLEGFDVGADDYITKPFIPKELIARIQAHLKRKAPSQKEKILHIDNLSVDYEQMDIYKDGELLNLFTKEKQLLLYLIEHSNKVLTVDQLINHIWGYDGVADSKTLSVHISTLRRKIEDTPTKPQRIQTIRGFGYKFVHLP